MKCRCPGEGRDGVGGEEQKKREGNLEELKEAGEQIWGESETDSHEENYS